MTKLRVQAQHMQIGDVVGSGERIESVWVDVRTPTGKINVKLSKRLYDKNNGQYLCTITRQNQWRKATMIGIEREQHEAGK